MPNTPSTKMTTDARSLADRLGSQTTEALIRAVAGVQQSASVPAEAARASAEAASQHIGQAVHGLAEGVQDVALPTFSTRMAWRAGRVVGRIEGAIRLAAFGVRFWWRRRRRQGQAGHAQDWTRPLLQWGPSVVACLYLATQLWRRIRGRAVTA
jgi:hypothetical protein